MSFTKLLPRKFWTMVVTVLGLLVVILMLLVLDKHKLDDHNAGQAEQQNLPPGSTP